MNYQTISWILYIVKLESDSIYIIQSSLEIHSKQQEIL